MNDKKKLELDYRKIYSKESEYKGQIEDLQHKYDVQQRVMKDIQHNTKDQLSEK
jgi:hypothetical protein